MGLQPSVGLMTLRWKNLSYVRSTLVAVLNLDMLFFVAAMLRMASTGMGQEAI